MMKRIIGGALVGVPLMLMLALTVVALGWFWAVAVWVGGIAGAASMIGGIVLLTPGASRDR